MRRSVEEELRLAAMDFEADVSPGEGLDVGPGFVDEGPLAAEFFPAIAGRGDVLDGMIAAGLIVGDGIAGAEIEDLVVRGVLADAEGDADETGARAAGRLDGDGGEVDVDGAVTEICVFDDGKSIAVGNVAVEANSFGAGIFGGRRFAR